LVLNEIIIDAPDKEEVIQHLCADKGYAGEPATQAMTKRGYIPHMKQRGEEIEEKKNQDTGHGDGSLTAAPGKRTPSVTIVVT